MKADDNGNDRLALTETATRLTEFAEQWRSSEKLEGEDGEDGEDADGDMKMGMSQMLTTPEDTTMLENPPPPPALSLLLLPAVVV